MNDLIRFAAIFLAIFSSCITMAQTPLTIRQVFDFNVGDEFQYISYSYSGGYPFDGSIRLLVLEKNISNNYDTITYRIEKSGLNPGNNFETDEFVVKYFNLDSSIRYLEYLNDKPVFNNYNSSYNRYNERLDEIHSDIAQGTIDSSCLENISYSDTLKQWQLDGVVHNSFYSYWDEFLNISCFVNYGTNSDQIFSEGLGSVKYQFSAMGFGGGYSKSYELQYYKKGNTIVGNPLDDFKDPGITMYPNPVKDMLYMFSKPSLIGKQFTIYNSTGKVIRKDKILDRTTTLSLSDLASGIYFLKIDGIKSEIYKIVKN